MLKISSQCSRPEEHQSIKWKHTIMSVVFPLSQYTDMQDLYLYHSGVNRENPNLHSVVIATQSVRTPFPPPLTLHLEIANGGREMPGDISSGTSSRRP